MKTSNLKKLMAAAVVVTWAVGCGSSDKTRTVGTDDQGSTPVLNGTNVAAPTNSAVPSGRMTFEGRTVSLVPITSADLPVPNLSPDEQVFEVRIRGENIQDSQAFLMNIQELTASTPEGKPLRMVEGQGFVDLANPNQAWLLGKVVVPKGVDQVKFSLLLDQYGGFAVTTAAGAIQGRGMPINWTAPLSWLEENGHAVVHLDLTRSLMQAKGETRWFIPALGIHY